MRGEVQVHVTKCDPEGTQTYGGPQFNHNFSMQTAQFVGDALREAGMCVIIRPLYNEQNNVGRFFREWRSFNGEPFKEVRWDL